MRLPAADLKTIFDPARAVAGRLAGDGDMNPGMPMDLEGGNAPRRKAAVLIPFVDRPDGTNILLTRRTEHLKHHSGQVAFPGGRIEREDPSPVHAALRETHEEVGIDPGRVDVLGELSLYRTRTGFDVTPVVGWVDAPVTFRPDPQEVAEVFEMPVSFLLDPAHHERRSRIFQGVERYFYVLPYRDYYIWGATAAMLVNLAEHINTALSDRKTVAL
ncbi:MAG: CoA pyrophosphatase [Alphaproteobacteria bacterium]|nr:CoA pyrophosphatase [Alphaproteobacteria bacterium]